MADVSIWDKFPNLTRTELRTLTAVTCQELMATEEGRQRFSHAFLQMRRWPGPCSTRRKACSWACVAPTS